MHKEFLRTILLLTIFFAFPAIAQADTLGESNSFWVEPIYDKETRNQVTATLRKVSSKAYFYIDNNLWNLLDYAARQEILDSIDTLSKEFDNTIYPILTSNFGSEWSPGIDNDIRITVLIHPMDAAGGYFRTADEYSILEASASNQREMIYFNSEYINSSLAKSYLAHEFTHLITFNQKDRMRRIEEDIWLNESRAEYASTLLGYDQDFEGSNLQMRARDFFNVPFDSLTEWKNVQIDYGVINLFAQYLTEHYGVSILADSLKSSKTGIDSINYALSKNGFSEDFSQIFTDWTIAVSVNDCALDSRYCYKNNELKKSIILPSIQYLPVVGESTLSTTYFQKDWAGAWYKIVGGKDTLKLEFSGDEKADFIVPYVIVDKNGEKEVEFLTLDEQGQGTVYISEFNDEKVSLTIIPLAQSKISGFGSSESSYRFSLVVSTVEEAPDQNAALVARLMEQIEELKRQIAVVQARISAILAERNKTEISCQALSRNLRLGMKGDDVRCLQELLRNQPGIYPQGLVTGYFGPLTHKAVLLFQEQHKSEVLTPLGLSVGTGYVGPSTRSALNNLL